VAKQYSVKFQWAEMIFAMKCEMQLCFADIGLINYKYCVSDLNWLLFCGQELK